MTTWTKPEGIILREISQTEKDKQCIISHADSEKTQQTKKTHRKKIGHVVPEGEGKTRGNCKKVAKRDKLQISSNFLVVQ